MALSRNRTNKSSYKRLLTHFSNDLSEFISNKKSDKDVSDKINLCVFGFMKEPLNCLKCYECRMYLYSDELKTNDNLFMLHLLYSPYCLHIDKMIGELNKNILLKHANQNISTKKIYIILIFYFLFNKGHLEDLIDRYKTFNNISHSNYYYKITQFDKFKLALAGFLYDIHERYIKCISCESKIDNFHSIKNIHDPIIDHLKLNSNCHYFALTIGRYKITKLKKKLQLYYNFIDPLVRDIKIYFNRPSRIEIS